MNILADGSLPGLEAAFPYPFCLSTYSSNQEIPSLLQDQDMLLCRSTLKVDKALMADHPLKYLGTASSGTDHIDRDYLIQQQIELIDAKGSNAVSVADYIMACLAWLNKDTLLRGKKAGIVGMGKVGSQVYSRLKQLGFTLFCYDPPKAIRDPSFQSCSLDALLQCDLLCIHAALHDEAPYSTYHLFDANLFDQLKAHCIVINAARGGIIQESALLASQKPLIYCTDVYSNEPHINEQIIEKATLCTPHIAGHTKEAKFAAVAMVSRKLHELLGLSIPHFAVPTPEPEVRIPQKLSWQKQLLSIYNPAIETSVLKQALDKKEAFLALRAHHHRYHMNFSFADERLTTT